MQTKWVHQILKVCKEHVRMCAVNTPSQNSVTNNSKLSKELEKALKFK